MTFERANDHPGAASLAPRPAACCWSAERPSMSGSPRHHCRGPARFLADFLSSGVVPVLELTRTVRPAPSSTPRVVFPGGSSCCLARARRAGLPGASTSTDGSAGSVPASRRLHGLVETVVRCKPRDGPTGSSTSAATTPVPRVPRADILLFRVPSCRWHWGGTGRTPQVTALHAAASIAIMMPVSRAGRSRVMIVHGRPFAGLQHDRPCSCLSSVSEVVWTTPCARAVPPGHFWGEAVLIAASLSYDAVGDPRVARFAAWAVVCSADKPS